jgi:hypothetical protein
MNDCGWLFLEYIIVCKSWLIFLTGILTELEKQGVVRLCSLRLKEKCGAGMIDIQ